MEERTNCNNCGAVLNYTKDDYGRYCKCKYCGSEYYINQLGIIENFETTFMFQGHLIKGYVSDICVEYNPIEITGLCDYKTKIICTNPEIKFEFIGHIVEKDV